MLSADITRDLTETSANTFFWSEANSEANRDADEIKSVPLSLEMAVLWPPAWPSQPDDHRQDQRTGLRRSQYEGVQGQFFRRPSAVLQAGLVKTPDLIKRLLLLLAHQAGAEVSVNKLANQLQMALPTVNRYLDLLEQTVVTFRLPSFSTNPCKEIAKSHEELFLETGAAGTGVIRPGQGWDQNRPDGSECAS